MFILKLLFLVQDGEVETIPDVTLKKSIYLSEGVSNRTWLESLCG